MSIVKISSERIDRFLFTIDFILSNFYISVYIYIYNSHLLQLKTRALYKVTDTVEEILYWAFDIRNLNSDIFSEHRIPLLFVYLYASNNGPASVYRARISH